MLARQCGNCGIVWARNYGKNGMGRLQNQLIYPHTHRWKHQILGPNSLKYWSFTNLWEICETVKAWQLFDSSSRINFPTQISYWRWNLICNLQQGLLVFASHFWFAIINLLFSYIYGWCWLSSTFSMLNSNYIKFSSWMSVVNNLSVKTKEFIVVIAARARLLIWVCRRLFPYLL